MKRSIYFISGLAIATLLSTPAMAQSVRAIVEFGSFFTWLFGG